MVCMTHWDEGHQTDLQTACRAIDATVREKFGFDDHSLRRNLNGHMRER
jgi:hypothetical protein